MIQANLKNSGRVGTWVFFTKYLFLGFFFSFNAAASVDYLYLQAGRLRPGGVGGQGQFHFFVMGGSKQIRTKKANFFSITFIWIIFFFKWEVKAGRGMIQSDKKFHAGWAHGGF